jgi:hypothetical protein
MDISIEDNIAIPALRQDREKNRQTIAEALLSMAPSQSFKVKNTHQRNEIPMWQR